jgi:hypothetical protein
MVEFAPDETEDFGELDEADSDGFIVGKKQKQSQKKKARKVKKPNSSLKQQDLVRLNVTDPQTKEEALFNAEVLLDMLESALSVSSYCRTAALWSHLIAPQRYFDLLQDPNVCLAIRNMFIVRAPAATDDHEQRIQQQTSPPAADDGTADSNPSAYPCVQPMKA